MVQEIDMTTIDDRWLHYERHVLR